MDAQQGRWAEVVASFEHQQAAAIVLATGKRFWVEAKSPRGNLARSFGSLDEATDFAKKWIATG